MTNIVAAIVGIVMVCCAGPTLGAGSVQTDRLDPRIGRANPELYRSVVDAKDWKNPYDGQKIRMLSEESSVLRMERKKNR